MDEKKILDDREVEKQKRLQEMMAKYRAREKVRSIGGRITRNEKLSCVCMLNMQKLEVDVR